MKLFAIAKERAARDELAVELPKGATIRDLREGISGTTPALNAILPHAIWAVDTEFASDKTILTEHSEVALIPPVSGG